MSTGRKGIGRKGIGRGEEGDGRGIGGVCKILRG